MDPIYANALNKRDSLRKQRASIDAELEQVEGWLRMYGQFAAGTAPQSQEKPPRRIATRADVVRHVCEVLADGRPKTTRALLSALELVYGLQMNGKDEAEKVVLLSQILGRERNRNGTFKVDRATGWSLAKPQEGKGPVSGGTNTGLFS